MHRGHPVGVDGLAVATAEVIVVVRLADIPESVLPVDGSVAAPTRLQWFDGAGH